MHLFSITGTTTKKRLREARCWLSLMNSIWLRSNSAAVGPCCYILDGLCLRIRQNIYHKSHFFAFLTAPFPDKRNTPPGLHFRKRCGSGSQKSSPKAAQGDSLQSIGLGIHCSSLLPLQLNTTKPQWFSFNIGPNCPIHILLPRLLRAASAAASEGLVTCSASADREHQWQQGKERIPY